MVEVIVKYNGNIYRASEEVNAQTEILSANYAILTLEEENISVLRNQREIEYIELPISLELMLDRGISSSCLTEVVRENGYNLTGKGVICGFLDSGIDYTHRDFRNADGTTRILYIWDQTIEGNAPEGFLGGSEFNSEDINNALNLEDIYSLGVTDFENHGTHIASIACGNGIASGGRYKGVAPESSLIVVKLGERGRESFARTTEIMRGVKYIIDKAIMLNMPVSINLSYGTNDGAHNGNSLFEAYLNDMCNIYKCNISVASGNEGDTAHHYFAEIKNNESNNCEFIVNDDNKRIFLRLWKSFNDEMSYEIVSPNGERSVRFRTNENSLSTRLQNTNVRIVFIQPSPYNILEGIYFELESNENVDTGIWQLNIYGENIVDGKVNIWLPITEIVGRNTRFLSPATETTLTIPSTAERVITVGGYNALTGAFADFSGRGFTADGRVKPDLIAPAVNVVAASSNNSYTALSGTSIATPFVTGSVALLMQWGIIEGNDIFLYGQRLKAFLQRGAKRENIEAYPNVSYGWGKLCVDESLRLLEEYSLNRVNLMKEDKKKYSAMQNESLITDAIYSDDYIDVVVGYDSRVEGLIRDNENVLSCKIIADSYAILYVRKEYFSELVNFLGSNAIGLEPFLMGTMETEALNASGITMLQNQPYLSLRGNDVLIGIIDTGIDYQNPCFIYEDGSSKIEYLWDQSIRGNSPTGLCYGSEFTNNDISNALKSDNPLLIVPSVDEVGHGTDLSAVSAGREVNGFIGAAPEANLIVVKLKQAKENIRSYNFIPENVPCFESSDVMMGIEYVLEKARQLDKPVSIIIGLGTNEGAHTGISYLERYMTSVASRNGVCLSCCVGNEADKQHHTFFQLNSASPERDIEIKVDNNENGFSLYIWSYIVDKISISIISPLGEVIERIYPSLNFEQEYTLNLSNTRVFVKYYLPVYQTSDQLTYIKFTNPTEGIWKIRVYADVLLLGNIHAWLPIANFIKEGTFFLSPDSQTTATTPSSAREISSVGAYDSRNNSLYPPSGRGPTRFDFLKPNYVAPGVNVESYGRNGERSVSGTSIATAVAGGGGALLLEWGIVRGNLNTMNTLTVTSLLIRGTNQPIRDSLYPNNLWGYGSIDLYKSIQNI